jgi:perosamine synthetase
MILMWSARRLDVSWSDLAAGLAYCCGLPAPQSLAEDGEILACLSVRSGFDLLLAALALPRGSEVLLSAVTIPDMARIVREHGLTPVPVDIDLATLEPRMESLRNALSSRSRVLVVAHLFGSRVPPDRLAGFAAENGLLLIDDVAQGFGGWPDRLPTATDAALYSFGPIKTATALGGALVRVAESALRGRMKEIQGAYPRQSRWSLLLRLLKFAALHAASSRPVCGVLVATLRALGQDYDRIFAGLFRGFPGEDLFAKIRRRPSAPLLALVARRLVRFQPAELRRRAAQARRLIDQINRHFFVPGVAAADHTHWAVPILAANPPRLIAALARAGFHATQPRSLVAIAPPTDRLHLAPLAAQRFMAEAVFLPVYRQMPDREIDRLADVLIANAAFASPRDAQYADQVEQAYREAG